MFKTEAQQVTSLFLGTFVLFVLIATVLVASWTREIRERREVLHSMEISTTWELQEVIGARRFFICVALASTLAATYCGFLLM